MKNFMKVLRTQPETVKFCVAEFTTKAGNLEAKTGNFACGLPLLLLH